MARAAARRRAQQRWRLGCAWCLLALVCRGARTDRVEQLLYPRKYETAGGPVGADLQPGPALVDAFIRTESGFDPVATSSVDARGLMQMTEETFLWLRSKIAADEDLAFGDLYDPDTSIRFVAATTCICVWNATAVMWPPLRPPTTAAGALWTICCGWRALRPTGRRCKASPTTRCTTMWKRSPPATVRVTAFTARCEPDKIW